MAFKHSGPCIALIAALIAAGAGSGSLDAASASSGSAALAPLIEGVPRATSVYHLHDSAGHSMDTLKVVRDPTSARYLGVYHWTATTGGFTVGVATSSDLRTWAYQRTLDTAASQPTLAFSPAPKNGPILAVEADSTSQLRFQYWTSVSSMLGTTAAYKTFDAPKTLSACAEGTPEIRSVNYATSASTITSGSTIVVSHHYFADCKTDRQAVGTLTNFGVWKTATAPAVDAAMSTAGSAGKHGDRDDFAYAGQMYGLYEGASDPYAASTWRPYLYDGATAVRLTVRTAAGSTAFANPSATVTVDPAGAPVLLVALLIPTEGAAAGETGELLYWVPLTTASGSPSASPTAAPSPSTTPSSSPSPSASPTAATSPSSSPSPSLAPTGSSGKVSKVLTIIEENHSLSQMQTGMPYLYGLAQRYAYASNYTAITHPSEPNYVAIGFGSTMSDTSDHGSAQNLSGPTVFGQAINAGKTAKVYEESMPSNCKLTNSPPYYVKHNPWPQAGTERTLCAAGDVPLGTTNSGELLADINAGTLPNVGFAVPNQNNDAHDGSLGTADNWLKGWLGAIMAGSDFQSGRLAIVVTADEDNATSVNKVLTVVLQMSLDGAHKVVSTPLTHYSLTGYYSATSGVPPLRNAASAPSFKAAFGL